MGLRAGGKVTLAAAALAAAVAWPAPAPAWRDGWGPPGPPLPSPGLRWPRHGYRRWLPPGAPFSFEDAATGATYCLSPATGLYFVCAYTAPAEAPGPPLRPAAGAVPAAASGLLLFRVPAEAEATVDGVPVELSQGLGVVSVRPGPHRVVVRVSGAAAEHHVQVASHVVYRVTSEGILPTAP